ncbi:MULTISPECIES: MFS transporter [Halolamina]|uniref:Predicted arabinose efflux permease, MFS family n=1 Tax=Halolamina pelagica TaxID=699431 RepID=A0A1I5MXN5_9EURY|nr:MULTISPECIES: MFS transporter [Halolamina]NHX36208.1 MFS transporter [Halolamina sp. R1-12]SFP14249.1 Predicted arabinose efflux permease, MFS family [Halolamina pelagica]
MRALLRERGFAALWLAQLITRIGDSIHEIALIWIVYEVTGDPRLVTLVALASFTPGVLLSIPAGVVVDRVNRKYLLVATEAIRGVVTLSIPIVGDGPYLVPVVIAVALIAGTMETFFGPAQQAMIPRLVPQADLDAANSLNNLTLSTSRLFYALGGVIVGVGGSFLAFYINAGTFLLSALVLLAVPATAGVTERGTDEASPPLLAEAREGIEFVRASPALLSVIAMGVFVDFAFVPLVVVLPIFAALVVGGGSVTYGFLLGSYFAGTLVGNLLIGPVREVVDARRGAVMVSATVFTGSSLALAAWLPTVVSFPLAAACAGMALAGGANPFLNVPLTTYIQATVPDEQRGKVLSVMRLGITGAAPIGIALAGPLVEAFGPVAVLLGMAAIVVAAGASGLATPLIRIGSVRTPE